MLKVAISALSLITFTATGHADVAPRQPAGARPKSVSARSQSIIDQQADRYLLDPCRAGISIIVRAGGRTYYSNRGVADRSTSRAPTRDSIYELASVTKTFAGALAAKALVEHRFRLDADFRSYLPKAYPNLGRDGTPITLRTLAAHSSGLQRDLPDSDALFAKLDYDRIGDQFIRLNRSFSHENDLAALREVQLRSAPGDVFAYSNVGIRVIGYGLETVYRRPFERLLRQSILLPLGMSSTTFVLDRSMEIRVSKPYGRSGAVQPFHDVSAGAAYGLYSTPRDMGRYLAWQLNEANPVVARAHLLIRGSAENGQAMIWNVGNENGQRVLWHGGGSFGETSQMVMFPDRQLGFVFLANDSCEGSEAMMKDLAISASELLQEVYSRSSKSDVRF